ncbi:VOC family protein [Chamaesiphon minutus]|uniref:Lactoylglutathione lyase-like lyase n=1 Tax=Chamaesiphon minutus (strain ATCC 27169 / PCC 6605) TaxID=1173020 RepID=K9UA61_CHAP6|nr:lactoylglutathione lyase-like lyase [Chamaesiphon minutus PCC 6605]
MLVGKIIRIARPTDRLNEVVKFYTHSLGLQILDRFENHQGFDGVMVGLPGLAYHLEFVHQQGHVVGRAPTLDNLLVFYIPDPQEWQQAIDRFQESGYAPVKSYNPYWDKNGVTFEDPDGYRVVLENTGWDVGESSVKNNTETM